MNPQHANFSFITYLYEDDPSRFENYRTLLKYYRQFCPNSTFILIWESPDVEQLQKRLKEDPQFNFLKTDVDKLLLMKSVFEPPNFWQSKGRNIAARQAATTPYFGFLEADAIVSEQSFDLALKALIEGRAQIAWPYDGSFINIKNTIRQNFINTLDFSFLRATFNQNPTHPDFEVWVNPKVHRNQSVGGFFMFEKESFWKHGAWNEKFVGWGYDDREIALRFQILEVPVFRSPEPLFHLNHENARRHTNQFIQFNMQEYMRISNLSKTQLFDEIKTSWTWSKR